MENTHCIEMGHTCIMPLKSKNIFTLEIPWALLAFTEE